MTNQTCTKPRVDAAKKRRRYLQETYISRVALASGCALGLLCATLLFVLASTYYSTDPGTIRMVNSTRWLYWSWGAFIDLASGPAPVVSSLCIVGLSSIFLSYSSARRLKTIPYVPPRCRTNRRPACGAAPIARFRPASGCIGRTGSCFVIHQGESRERAPQSRT